MRKIHKVPQGTISQHYPLIKHIGTQGKKLKGGLPPSTSLTNSSRINEIASAFGLSSKHFFNSHKLSAPAQSKNLNDKCAYVHGFLSDKF